MNDQPILTDARIEAMLARRAGRGSPGGLAEAIRSAVSESGQVGRPLWTYLLPPSRQAPTLRLAWVIALIGLLLAAAVSVALVGGELLRRSDELTVALPVPSNAPSVVPDTIARHPVALQPTGVIEATGRRLLSLAGTSGLAVGPDGETWALGSGRLLRIDASGDIREWTLVDDAAFGSAQGLSPSQFGGVWLFDGRALRRFDGSIFTDVVETPLSGSTGTYLTDALEAPDGQLWVTAAKGVFRWDGASWTALPWPFDALPGEIGFDRDGRPWVGLYEYPGPYGLGVAMYDETAWTEYSPEAVPLHGAGSYDDPQGGEVVTNVTRSITSSSDGSVWFATEGGLARFDGVTWSEEHPFGPARTTVSSVSVAPDGTVWVASSGSAGPGSARAARRDGSVWQELDLPADMEDFGGWAVVAATVDGVVFASDGGVLRLAGNEWARAWPAAPPTGPGYVSALVAASADEVLAGSASWDGGPAAVWTFRRGTWERDTSPGAPNQSIRSLALGADGSLWAGGEGGLQVKRGEKWSSVIGADPGESVWQVLPLADGTVWVTVSAFEPDKAGLVALRPDGSTWRREEIGGSPLQWLQSVAVTRDGSVWVGSSGGWGPATPGLARYDGQAWTIEHPLGAPPPEGNSLRVGPLLSASDGSLWVAGEEWPTEDPGEVPPRFFVARFSDGEWTVSLEVDWPMSSLAEHPDGSILAAGSGVWTFRDGRWSEELAGQFLDRLSIAPDGSVWASGNDVYRIR